MRRLPLSRALPGLHLLRALACLALLGAAAAPARAADAPPAAAASGAAAAAADREARSGAPLPRVVQALGNALGQGRQRLALVVGVGTVGARPVLETAPRDTQAVAAALRAAGFVVMVREDLNGTDLRASLQEFRTRLQPAGLGFVYFTGLGAQAGGRNLLLPRDARLDGEGDAAAVAARLGEAGVPLQDLVAALGGGADAPRLLVVDAAWRHAALAPLPRPGLAEPALQPGVMALFSAALATAQDLPAVAPPPAGADADPTALAAGRFARVLVAALRTPRISGAEALRRTRRAIVEASGGQWQPWLGGDTDGREELAEVTLVDGLLPRTPEDVAREGLRLLARQTGAEGAAPPAPPAAMPAATAVPAEALAADAGPARAGQAQEPGARKGSGLADALGTAAGVAGTLATAAAGVKVAEAGAALAAAGSVAGTATTALDVASGAGKRLLASGGAAPGATPAATAPPAGAANAAGTAGAAIPAAPAAAATPAARLLPAAPPGATAAAGPAPAPSAAPAATAPGAAATTGPAAGGTPAPAWLAAAASDPRTQRMPEGGERPRFVPRVNTYGHAEGDTYTFQTVDTWKDEPMDSHTIAIDEVMGDGELMANGQNVQMDPQGRLKLQRGDDGSLTQWTPHQDLWWARPQPGESRALQFTETFERPGAPPRVVRWSGTARVGSARSLQTPAGEFEVLPVTSSGWTTEPLRGGGSLSVRFSRTAWYAPRLGRPVRIDIEDADPTGQVLRRERVELLHAQQARDTP